MRYKISSCLRTFFLGLRLIWLCKEGGGTAFGRPLAAITVAGGIAVTFTALAAVTAVTVAAAAFARLAWLATSVVAGLSALWLSFIARRLGGCVLRQAEAVAGCVNRSGAVQVVHRCALAHQGNGDCVRRGVLAI